MNQKRVVLALKILLWLGALAPAAYLVSGIFTAHSGSIPSRS